MREQESPKWKKLYSISAVSHDPISYIPALPKYRLLHKRDAAWFAVNHEAGGCGTNMLP